MAPGAGAATRLRCCWWSWAQPPWSPCPAGSPRGTAPDSRGTVSSGRLAQLQQELLYITPVKISKCKYQIYFLGHFCKWLCQTTVPSAVHDILNQTLLSVPPLSLKYFF